jgi:hypothetical protein
MWSEAEIRRAFGSWWLFMPFALEDLSSGSFRRGDFGLPSFIEGRAKTWGTQPPSDIVRR